MRAAERRERGRGRRKGKREKWWILLPGMLVSIAAALVFYNSWLAIPFLLPLGIPVGIRCAKGAEQRRKKELSEAFREMTADLLTGLRAGYSVENALRDCRREMIYRYGENSPMAVELTRIVNGLDNRIPVEKLMMAFAERSGVEEIHEFGEVFSIAKRSGGNMSGILQRTISLIQNRMETEKEIQVMISGRKLEQHIMDIIPAGIILYIRMSSPDFFAALYHNPTGILIMSVCLGIYLAAYLLSERITDIHV